MNTKRSTVIATICARGGSKGLPRKNVLQFGRKPLIAHTIAQALACPSIAEVYVSTDDEEIAEVAAHYGAQVPYRRPSELATDTASKIPAIEHLVRHLESYGRRIETVVDLQPTSPLRASWDISKAIDLAHDAALVVSVTEPSHSPYYTLVEQSMDGVLHLSKRAAFVRRQDAPQVWGLNGSIYVWRRDALAEAAKHGFWSVEARPYVMPRNRSVDIDTAEDFELAQWLYMKQQTQQAPI
ncbi:acylneuraminate cytidylyltransferase family protein [Variovorax robiniae]|uniref:Acylneuraminate cytidylyltransferase family protein n=1 Tax=Variovorax robiniae TaxID=1836199 RepID=A0ABU8XH56_9BURK